MTDLAFAGGDDGGNNDGEDGDDGRDDDGYYDGDYGDGDDDNELWMMYAVLCMLHVV